MNDSIIAFYHFDTRTAMDSAPLKETDIAFCKEDGIIKTHGSEYGGGSEVSVQETSPESGSTDKLYFEVTEEDDGFYIDTEAPLDGKVYGRYNGQWVEVLNKDSADKLYAMKDTYNLSNEPSAISMMSSMSSLDTVSSEDYGTTPINSSPIPMSISTSRNKNLSVELSPNIYYKFKELKSLTISLLPGDKSTYNKYVFRFQSGSSPTKLIVPESVKWPGGINPIIESNTIYVVTIADDLATINAW